MSGHLSEIIRLLSKEMRNRRETRELLERDDRLLDDIGVTRADIESALSQAVGLPARREALRLTRRAFYIDGARFGAPR